MSRNLVIDIGNSMVKLAIFDGSELKYLEKCPIASLIQTLSSKKYKESTSCILSSTKNINPDLRSFLDDNYSPLIFSPSHTPIPVTNLYKSKETLGADRLANAIGAASLCPNRNTLIIDCGTALTFDYINSNAEYLGGTISLGLKMRFQALNHYTDKLPMLEAKEYDNTLFIGENTESSIMLGVINGIVGEIDSTIKRATLTFDNLNTIITGGDSLFLEKKINSGIFVSRILTLVGLNSILNYNAKFN